MPANIWPVMRYLRKKGCSAYFLRLVCVRHARLWHCCHNEPSYCRPSDCRYEQFTRLPIFPPALLLQRSVWTSYSIALLQIAAQVGVCFHRSSSDLAFFAHRNQMLFSVPMYFQLTECSSNTTAGLHLVPAVIGNTVGGLLAGFLIEKYEVRSRRPSQKSYEISRPLSR